MSGLYKRELVARWNRRCNEILRYQTDGQDVCANLRIPLAVLIAPQASLPHRLHISQFSCAVHMQPRAPQPAPTTPLTHSEHTTGTATTTTHGKNQAHIN